MEKKTSRFLLKQPVMRRMLIGLAPCIVASVYFFGWRSLFLIAVSCTVAFLAEYLFSRRLGESVTEAVFVSAVIYALIMPPTVSVHVLVIGMVFAIIFGKMVFGGFGFNIFNPAMAGRAFVYICFPVALTATWAPAASGAWGALGMWSTVVSPDVITAATPMAMVKAGVAAPPLLSIMFLGRLAGTMGVTSVLAILLGGIYVFVSRTANRYIIVTVIAVYALMNSLLVLMKAPGAAGVLPAIMGGGFLFGAFFMATDPISAPKTRPAQVIYAAIIAASTSIIRTFSVFNGGLMFSILLANMFAPILDHGFRAHHAKKDEGDHVVKKD